MTTLRHSRIQRVRWFIGDLLGKLLVFVFLLVLRISTPTPALAAPPIVSIVEATEACGAEQIPVLDHVETVVVSDGLRIELIGVPVWSCALKPS